MQRFLISSVCLAILQLGVAQAKEPAFVGPDEIRVVQLLPTPPVADSAQTRAELAELRQLEGARTEQQVERVRKDEATENMFLFQAQMGDWFNAQQLPLMAAFAAHVKNDEGVNTTPLKQVFSRVRPYNLDPALHPVCKTKTVNDSYPSGHATSGYMLALSLIDVAPQMRDVLLARADEYANNRLLCGVHFRSDIQASKVLAYSIHAAMVNKPQYQQEMLAARAELQRFMPLTPGKP